MVSPRQESRSWVTACRRATATKSVVGPLKLVAGQQQHCVKSFIDSNAYILSRDCCRDEFVACVKEAYVNMFF